MDLVRCVPVLDFVGHNFEEFFKANGAAASFVIIEGAECLEDFVLCVPVRDFVGHNFEELSKANGAAASFVIIREAECLEDLSSVPRFRISWVIILKSSSKPMVPPPVP